MLLSQIPLGRPARVTRVDGAGHPVMLRLMEMGLVRGASVEIRKRAPFGGPLELRVEGYLLSIRSAEASRFDVELAPARDGVPSHELSHAEEAA